MQNLLNELTELLSKDDRLITEGRLLKNKVIELALGMDSDLIKLLLKNENIKKHFFTDVDGVLVFDKIKFQRFVTNKQFLPDSYTAFKNKIGLVNENGDYLSENREVVLAWPYKDCVLEGGQTKEDQKRDEIFWNETLAPDEIDRLLAPKAFTCFKRYDKDGEHVLDGKEKIDFANENLIIKGNNLLALHSLYKKFNEQAYLKVLLDDIFKDNYLFTMFVQVRYEGKTLVEDMDFQKLIETIHVYRKSPEAKLRKVEEEYSIDKFIWSVIETGKPKCIELGGKKVEIFKPGDYIIEEGAPGPNKLKEIWASGKVLDGNSSGRFFRDYLQGRFDEDGFGVLYKVYDIGDDQYNYRYFTGPKRTGATKGKYYQGIPNSRLTEDITKKYLPIINFYNLADYFGNCRHEGGVELRSGKKPEELLRIIIELATNPGDIVLDFHLGTGTTCSVALKMGRKFIGIEQLDYDKNDSVIRLQNVINGDKTGISSDYNWQGGGSFIYCELMEWNEAYISRIQKTKTSTELFTIWEEMQQKAFISYKVDPKSINDAISDFKELSLDDQKRFLIEILDKNQLYVNYSEIDDADYQVSETDKKLNRMFYGEG